MNTLIVVLVLTAFLYSSTQAALCSSNVCDLGGYFVPAKGYQCIQQGTTALCTCPGGLETDMPCRLCNRVNPAQNVCRNLNGKLLACLEDDSQGTSYACLCSNGAGGTLLTTDADCDPTVTLTPRPTTSTLSYGPSSICSNGGIFFNGICNCPSGYSGGLCADRNEPNLCERIICKNNGTCAIRNTNGPYEGVCLCRYGYWGEYCELIGTLGFCSAGSCLNGGSCKENLIAATRHAYCTCPAGYNGAKCENRYFTCTVVGRFSDPLMFNQGKYIECTNINGILRAEQKSCARGLRYNANNDLCTY